MQLNDEQSIDENTMIGSPNTEHTGASNEQQHQRRRTTTFTFQVEKYRLIAYVFFWCMCFIAMAITQSAVAPNLGPCPLTEGADPTYGLHCSVLVQNFGFNNICVNWDYSPSREITALVYPAFEYGLIFYLVLNFLQIMNDYHNDEVGPIFFRLAHVLFWIKIVLVSWFRMIFVCTVTQDPIPFFGTEIPAVLGHTLGFIGMQIALILIAIENAGYTFYTHQKMFCLSPRWTKVGAGTYLGTLIIITGFKLSWAISFFATGTPWFTGELPHIIDRLWMFLAAVLPLFFAINGMRTEPKMRLTVVNMPRVNNMGREESNHDFAQFPILHDEEVEVRSPLQDGTTNNLTI